MTDQKNDHAQQETRPFLPLGSVVILKGSVKKLLIVSRGSIVEDGFFDYGAFLYPEGMIDTNIAYFNNDDIQKTVFEGFQDDDDELVVDILNDAYVRFHEQGSAAAPVAVAQAPAAAEIADDDPFANVRDLDDDDE